MVAHQKIQEESTWNKILEIVEKTKHKLITEDYETHWNILTDEQLRESIREHQHMLRTKAKQWI